MGKSALLARFVQLCRWAPELRAKAAELVDWASLPLPLPLPRSPKRRHQHRRRLHQALALSRRLYCLHLVKVLLKERSHAG